MTDPDATRPDPDREQTDKALEDLDAETVEDLDVDEESADVKGGTHSLITVCPSMPPCMTL